MYKIGEAPSSSAQTCDDWYNRNSDSALKTPRIRMFAQMPQCPCKAEYFGNGAAGQSDWPTVMTLDQAGIWEYEGPRKRQDGSDMYCYKLSKTAASQFVPYGKIRIQSPFCIHMHIYKHTKKVCL